MEVMLAILEFIKTSALQIVDLINQYWFLQVIYILVLVGVVFDWLSRLMRNLNDKSEGGKKK